MRSINIVGGGVVGLCAAVSLADAGFRVTVFDDDHMRTGASWGNAGHIAIEQAAPLASLSSLRTAYGRRFNAGGALDLPVSAMRHWLPFAFRFIAASMPARFDAGCSALGSLLARAMPSWQAMAAGTGNPDLVRAGGHYILWDTSESAAAGMAAWRAADIGTATLSEASADEIARLDALVALPIGGASRFEGSGQIADLDQLADALETALRVRGGSVERVRARLVVDQGLARVDGYDGDLVLVAAGVRSREVMEGTGYKVPIIAERGYHIRASADNWPADMPPLVFEDRSMIVTRYTNEVQAASFVELQSDDAPPDPRKWRRLEQHVRELGLPVEPPFTYWMGARPTLPDYLPAIGRSRHVTNLLYAFGHQHLGMTLAAITGELVTALAQNAAPTIDLAPFDLSRFGARK